MRVLGKVVLWPLRLLCIISGDPGVFVIFKAILYLNRAIFQMEVRNIRSGQSLSVMDYKWIEGMKDARCILKFFLNGGTL